MKFISNNFFLPILLIIILPIFFIPNMWDGVDSAYSFSTGDYKPLFTWINENSQKFHYIPYLFLIYAHKFFIFLNYEFLFDLFTLIFFFLFICEVKKLSLYFLENDLFWSNISALFVVLIPIWEVLTAIPIGMYIFFSYFALIGIRFFIKKKNKFKFLGILFILFSLSIPTNYFLAVSILIVFSLKKILENKNKDVKKNIYLIFFLILIFFIDRNLFPPYGWYENNYSSEYFKFDNLKKIFFLTYNFFTFFIFYLWIPIFYFILILIIKKKKINFLNKKFFSDILLLILFFFFVIFPYIYVGKSAELFYWSDWHGRHAIPLSIVFGLFFTLLFKNIYQLKKNQFLLNIFLIIFLLQSLIIFSGKIYFKLEAKVFASSMVKELKKFTPPESGFIIFEDHENIKFDPTERPGYYPGHELRYYEITYYFFRAYNRQAWLPNMPKSHSNKYLDFQKYKKFLKAEDFNFEKPCKIIVSFKNFINLKDRILKLYILKPSEYFNISSVKSECSNI